jgi:hypothetical protein
MMMIVYCPCGCLLLPAARFLVVSYHSFRAAKAVLFLKCLNFALSKNGITAARPRGEPLPIALLEFDSQSTRSVKS